MTTQQRIDRIADQFVNPTNFDSMDAYITELERFKEALTEFAEEQEKWLPIETAPKDGHTVLLASESYVTIGYWGPRGHRCSVIGKPSMPFTHWQPLPPAPSTDEKPE